MTVLYGNRLAINGVAMTEQFALELSSDSQPSVDSASSGGSYRPCGNQDWQVTYRAKGGTPAVFPNDRFLFEGVLATDGRRAYGYLRTKQIEVNVMGSEKGAYVWHTVTAGGAPTAANEVLQFDGTAVTDAAVTTATCAAGLGLEIDDVAEDNVEWMRLRIGASFEPFVDSGLSGWYQRQAGNIDWLFTYRRKFGDWAELPECDQISDIKMYVSSDTYWTLRWGRFTRPLAVEIAAEDRLPIAATCLAQMTGAYASNLGYIKDPGSNTKWP